MENLWLNSYPATWLPRNTRSKWADIPRYTMDPVETGILRQLRDLATFRAAAEETVARVFGDRFDVELTFDVEAEAEEYDMERLKERYEKGRGLKGKVNVEDLKTLMKESKEEISEKDTDSVGGGGGGGGGGKKRKRGTEGGSVKRERGKMKLKDHYVNNVIRKYWVPFLREMFIYIKMWGFCPYRLKAVDYKGELHYYPTIPPIDSGFVEVYQNHDREVALLWNWLDTEGMFKDKQSLDKSIDESVRFVVKNMPSVYGKYNSDLMSLAKDYLHLDITEDLQTQSNLQKAYPTHIVEYHESGKSSSLGEAESQWYQPFSRNDLNLQFEKYKRDKYYEDSGFQSTQFFFAHDKKNVKNAAELTGLSNFGTEGYVTPSRLKTLEKIHKSTQRRMDVTSATAGPAHPSVQQAFNTRRLEENEKFVNVAFPQVGDPDYQKKKDRFDRLTSIVADNSLFMSLVTEKPIGGNGAGSGAISKNSASIQETKLHFASRYKSIIEFYSDKVKEVWIDAYACMFEIELKKGKHIFKQEYKKKWGKKASKEEVDIFTSLLNVEVKFPKASFLSVSELKEMWDLGLISEKDFYNHAVTVTGVEHRGEDGVARVSKRLKQIRDAEKEANQSKLNKGGTEKKKETKEKKEKIKDT